MAEAARRAPGDMKHGLTGSRPKMSIIGKHAKVHCVRAMEYGADYYERGNYHGPPPRGASPEDAFMGYVDAAMRHLDSIAQAYNEARGRKEDIRAALAGCLDRHAVGKPPSMLHDVSHAMASLMIAIERGVQDGILPADPGQPWREGRVTEDRSPQAAAMVGAEKPQV